MKHKESDLQIRCFKWFRYQYPAYATLMEHPKNEGNGNRRQGAIAKAEGVTPGVADVILHVPAYITGPSLRHSDSYHALALELKTITGRQSPEQRCWQRLFEAAGGLYVIVRSYEDFVTTVTRYMLNVPADVDQSVRDAYHAIQREQNDQAVRQFKKLIKK